MLAGGVVGGVLAATIGASAGAPAASGGSPAATGGYAPPPASYAAAGPDGRRQGPPRPAMQDGTVTAVGADTVGIKTAAGTKTYAVDGNSDIDKNGEAKLSDLVVGDAVHFALRPGTSTIAVLHAGDEAKNRPARGGHDGPCPGGRMGGGSGPRPTASPSSTA